MSFLLEDNLSVQEKLALIEACDAPNGKDRREVNDNEVKREPSSNSTQGVASRKNTGTRRVNRSRIRMKEELKYLRQQVETLEGHLERLRSGRASPSTADDPACMSSHQQVSTTWERLASRQFSQRQQAEIQNMQLKELLEKQLRTIRSLEKLLRKRPNLDALGGLETLASSMKRQRLDANSDSIPFNRSEWSLTSMLVEGLGEAYAQMDSMCALTGLGTHEDVFRDYFVGETVERGLHVDVVDCVAMPFDMETTASATWKMIQDEVAKGGGSCTLDRSDHLETVVSRADEHMNMRELQMQFAGMFAVRRYTDAKNQRVVIVWRSRVKYVADAAAAVDCGFEYMEETGWMIIRRARDKPVTLLHMCCRVEPRFEPHVEPRIGFLTDFVTQVFDDKALSMTQMIENFALADTPPHC